jgi:hypothetical protein
MAKASDKTELSAEKAYAEAAAKAKPVKRVAAAKPAKVKPAPVRKRAARKAPAKQPVPIAAPAPVAEAPEPVAVVVEVPEPVVPVAEAVPAEAPEPVAETVEEVPAEAPAEAPAPSAITPPRATPMATIAELKEKIMAAAKTPDFTKPVTDAVAEFQSKAKEAYDKSTEALTEATEFAKGNVEAIVESGKIYAAGVQDLGKSYVDEAKSAYETLTADLKEMAAIKSPTELFQLQGKIMRRNFDALVATGSKNTEAMVKLANDTFAPISGRVNLAAEKLAKVA